MPNPGSVLDKLAQQSERRRLKNADREFLPPDSNFKPEDSYFLRIEGNLTFQDAHGPHALPNVIRKEFFIRIVNILRFLEEDDKSLAQIHKASQATIAIASSQESRLHSFRHLELWGTAQQVDIAEKLIIDAITRRRYLRSSAPTILMQAPACRHEVYIRLSQVCKLLGSLLENVEKLEVRCGVWIKVDPFESPSTGYTLMQRLVLFGSREQVYQALVIINEVVLEPYMDPSLPAISVQHGFTGVTTRIEGLAPEKEGARKCAATSSAEEGACKRASTSFTAYTTRVSRNVNIDKLQAGDLFQEIGRRKAAHMLKYPDAQVISLGIDDDTDAISELGARAIAMSALGLHSTCEGYNVCEAGQGVKLLRAQLASTFYANLGIDEDDIFVSGGAQSDISRLQVLFGSDVTLAVQDPSCLAYIDSSVIVQTFANIEYMKCTPENDFFPDLSKVSRTDIIYFCSPNNPTGSAASREQLIELVKFAKDNGSIIVYDSAYAMYVSGDTPRSIFEIPGAKEVAIETASFFKYAGITALGWTAVPKELKFSDGFPVAKAFNRMACTGFNGASNIAQDGGLACLSSEGLEAMHGVVGLYKESAKIIVDTFTSLGFKVYGGMHAPYVWLHFPGRSSWDIFSEILEKTHVVTTPGSGFGPAGEGFVRVSAFGHRNIVMEACRRFKEVYKRE